jgi:hypothetical protein
LRLELFWQRVARALVETYAADIESWSGQIASQFEQAGMAEEAVEYYARAASHARLRYADVEAADLLRRALALCRGFPESDRRLKQELDLLVTLGPALVATEGYSAPEVGKTYHRAPELSKRFDDRNQFAILSGSWGFHAVRGDLEETRRCSLEFLAAVEREPTPGLMVAANFLMGSCLFHLGEMEASLKYMTAAISSHGGPAESNLTLFAGPDLGVFCRSYLAHLAWHREDGDHGNTHAAEAIATANRIKDPFSQAIALVILVAPESGFSGPWAVRIRRRGQWSRKLLPSTAVRMLARCAVSKRPDSAMRRQRELTFSELFTACFFGEHTGQQDSQYQPDLFAGICSTAGRWPHFSHAPCTEEDWIQDFAPKLLRQIASLLSCWPAFADRLQRATNPLPTSRSDTRVLANTDTQDWRSARTPEWGLMLRTLRWGQRPLRLPCWQRLRLRSLFHVLPSSALLYLFCLGP